MTSQFRYRLLVHAVVEHSGYEVVAEGVKVEPPGKSVLIMEPTEMPGKSIGVHQFTVLVRKHIVAHLEAAFPRLVHFVVAVTAKNGGHFLADVDRPGLTILGRSLHHTLARKRAAGAADR